MAVQFFGCGLFFKTPVSAELPICVETPCESFTELKLEGVPEAIVIPDEYLYPVVTFEDDVNGETWNRILVDSGSGYVVKA